MKTKDIFNLLHNAVESKHFGKKISQKEMAENLGVSMRTYQDWKLGNSEPQAVKAIMKMLCELDEEDVSYVLKRICRGLKESNE
ncbi:MAG: helix-turn-helix transcriptional regulator [Sulfurospirillaceae bacterium]|jgi:transcriptional regulator with XRE-family HTH domain|nr:helix-turn-helix transcriptional regulator [Sulfurospirillaceae bacterium]MCK9546013.1 helix-turn-helix transcriptional regulator [Sulfurospirillaceae bacterium]MDY0237653.1 helix-turn-helix transcriptional regulator [Campylobacterales bacterium]NLM98859.1 helix-turn-helix transcriptional regulator [Campylobacteraceae bacterium]